ncbi:MAG: SDR family oxidoreductase [Anaerolineales bacterium]|nr:SDR family oxidoreductase [Anaerolineales bacterium]
MKSNSKFQGKVAVVTGAANGIGLATSLAFAREESALLLLDIEKSALEAAAAACSEAGSSNLMTEVIDISIREEFETAINQAVNTLGRIDILVNNAAAYDPPNLFEEISDDTWQKIFSVNVMGTVNGCRAVIPIMKQQRSGRIINASSMYGVTPQTQRTTYSVSKSAVITITRVLAAELGPYGITVNAYAPGTIRTKMAGEAVTSDRARKKCMEIPLGRFGEPSDVADTILFLASDEAKYISGTVLSVDGGTQAVKNPERAWADIEFPW